MKITAITEDQMIIIDGNPASMRDIGGFHMTRGEWALHYNTVTQHGEIEYLDNRPNQTISASEFNRSYSWLIEEHQRYLEHIAQLNAEAAAQALEQENGSENTTDDSSGGSPTTSTN